MMAMAPYPGFEGDSFSMPCRNVLPKPLQKPHPPLWMACTNRDTIRVAASKGVGALAFSFVDPDEARNWSRIYYDTIKSDACVPIGHGVNANIAMVSAFSIHPDRDEAIRRGQQGFEFFGFALASLVARDSTPGRSRLWETFQRERGARAAAAVTGVTAHAPGIGTPADLREHLRSFEAAGIDQVIFLQQAGKNRHADICASLELFGAEVLPEFAAEAAAREAEKARALAPFVEAALARKPRMRPLADEEIPVVRASVAAPIVNRG
jgi:alkanesulfonate monooxygenase SsuD/methylene tetrahydromethanopterin reductase-like flavin-dependent oxidoreductase (luciferase family)